MDYNGRDLRYLTFHLKSMRLKSIFANCVVLIVGYNGNRFYFLLSIFKSLLNFFRHFYFFLREYTDNQIINVKLVYLYSIIWLLIIQLYNTVELKKKCFHFKNETNIFN